MVIRIIVKIYLMFETPDEERAQIAHTEASSPESEPHEVVEGCIDCPHPDYCAGIGRCEIGAERLRNIFNWWGRTLNGV